MLYFCSGFSKDSAYETYLGGIFTPSPAKDEIVVAGINNNCKYIIYDSMGKIVKIGVLDAPYSINVAQFLQGTYILRTSMNDGYSYVKFLKQ